MGGVAEEGGGGEGMSVWFSSIFNGASCRATMGGGRCPHLVLIPDGDGVEPVPKRYDNCL